MKSLCCNSAQVPSLSVKRKRQSLIKAEIEEIRVCTNRSCRRQGSIETLETVSGLAPANVSVKTCGCLGRCGAGPNLVLLPEGIIEGHCGTAARAAQIMKLCGCNNNNKNNNCNDALSALALRKRAEVEIDKANFSEAHLLLSQAIDLNPFGAIHIIYKHRSHARLATGNYTGALEDAIQALTLAPYYLEAYICQGDAFLAMDQYDAAEKSYSTCLEIDPSIRRSKSFKTRIANLQDKLTAGNLP